METGMTGDEKGDTGQEKPIGTETHGGEMVGGISRTSSEIETKGGERPEGDGIGNDHEIG